MDWTRHSPEELQGMLASLDRLHAEGLYLIQD